MGSKMKRLFKKSKVNMISLEVLIENLLAIKTKMELTLDRRYLYEITVDKILSNRILKILWHAN